MCWTLPSLSWSIRLLPGVTRRSLQAGGAQTPTGQQQQCFSPPSAVGAHTQDDFCSRSWTSRSAGHNTHKPAMRMHIPTHNVRIGSGTPRVSTHALIRTLAQKEEGAAACGRSAGGPGEGEGQGSCEAWTRGSESEVTHQRARRVCVDHTRASRSSGESMDAFTACTPATCFHAHRMRVWGKGCAGAQVRGWAAGRLVGCNAARLLRDLCETCVAGMVQWAYSSVATWALWVLAGLGHGHQC